MSSMDVTNLNIQKLKTMFEEGKRFDGRKLDEFRKIEISYDVSNKAEGSARVKLGKTEVIAGVKMVVGTPYPDSPDKGNLSVSADLLPLASPRYEVGPPKFNAIELPRLVDRAIRGAEMIELNKLCIEKGEKVWTVMIDVYPINDDGNMVDAATIAAIAALHNAKVPELNEEGRVDYDKESKKKLPLLEGTYPISISFYKLGNSLILDPTREEEEACDVRLNWAVSHWNGKYMINSSQKSGELTMSKKEIEHMMALLPKKFEDLNAHVKKQF